MVREEVKKLIDENLLKQSDNNIYIPEEKLFISNEIIIKLLDNYILEWLIILMYNLYIIWEAIYGYY